MPHHSSDRPRQIFFAAALVVVLAATLFPVATLASPDACGALDLTCGDTRAVDMILNVALFLPLGAAVQLRWRRAWIPVTAGLLLSAAIEVLQGTVIPGRDPSLRDAIANTAGAAGGGALVLLAPVLARPGAGAAAALTGGLAAALTAVLLVAGSLLQISLPRGLWFGQHQAVLQGFDYFPGKLLSASMAGAPLPSGLIRRDAGRRVVASRSVELGARVVPLAAATWRLAPIVSVFEAGQRKVGILGQIGTVVAFTPRLRAEDWGFRPVVARFPDIDLAATRDTLDLAGGYRDGVIFARVSRAGAPDGREYRHGLGPADWWRLVLPWGVALSAATAQWVTAATLLLWFAAMGWYAAGWATGPWRAAAALAGTAVPAVLALAPGALGYPPAPLPAWVGVATGLVVGWTASAWRRRGALAAPGAEGPPRSRLHSRVTPDRT